MSKSWACPHCGNERLGIYYGDGGIMMLPHPDKNNSCVRLVCPCGWGVQEWSATGDEAWLKWEAKAHLERLACEANAKAAVSVIADKNIQEAKLACYRKVLEHAAQVCIRNSALEGDELSTLARDIREALK